MPMETYRKFIIVDLPEGRFVYPEGHTVKREPKIKTEEEALVAFDSYLKGNTRGYPDWTPDNWVKCVLMGRKAPPDRMIEVWSLGQRYQMVEIFDKKENVFKDWEGKRHLTSTEKPIEVYTITGETKIYSSYNFDSKHGIYSVLVARGIIKLTDFDPGYRDHSAGSSKSFIKPEGEAIGIEIEVKFKNVEKDGYIIPDYIAKLLFSHWMKTNYPDWICERDGSLEGERRTYHGGLEIISPPLSVAKLHECLDVILPKCVEMGGIGAKASTSDVAFGIHVTQNLYGPFSRKDGDRYTYLINLPALRPFWQAAAQRYGALFDKFCGFMEIDSVDGAMKHESGSHYRAVFPRGESAVETRIFRSNLQISAVKSIVELCIVAMNYCKQSKVNVNDPAAFITYVKAHASNTLKQYIRHFGGFIAMSNDFEA